MRVGAVLLAVAVAACGSGATPTEEPTDPPWGKSMSATTCREWRTEMTDGQRYSAAEAVVGYQAALRLVFAVDDTCDTLGALATSGDPAMISDVVELVIITDDFTPLP